MALSRYIHFKLRRLEKAQQDQVLEAISGTPGVLNITQTFPNHEIPEIRLLYVVTVEDDHRLGLLEKLISNPAVAYAGPAGKPEGFGNQNAGS